MNKTPHFIGYLLVLLFSCNAPKEFPTPLYSTVGCQAQSVQLDFVAQTYSLNGMPFESFNQKIVGWIPAEDEPTFYLISYQMRFCNILDLNLNEYNFQLEEINNPDGYWYEITTTEEILSEILNGKVVDANFEKWVESDDETAFMGPLHH